MVEQNLAIAPEQLASELTHAEKLDRQTGIALDITAKILNDGALLLQQDGLAGPTSSL